MNSSASFLSVEAARERILDLIQPIPGIETLPLAKAHGRVLATSPAARVTQPPAPVSAMDGYAMHAEDVPVAGTELRLVGISQAGTPFDDDVPRGTAIRILTGAVVPAGATTVVMQEETAVIADDMIRIDIIPAAGANIRAAGQDFSAGETPLATDKQLTARDIGLLAAMNVPQVDVRRKPVVAILATGDEIKTPGSALKPGEIVGSSGPALAAMLESWGCEVRDMGIAADNHEALAAGLKAALGADLLLTTGGVSVGTHDLVRDALAGFAAGADGKLDFWRIAMRPGKPLMLGRLGDLPVIGLPGNPVSSIVCALLFAWPAIRKLRALTDITLPTRPARLLKPLAANGQREHYMRAMFERDKDGQIHVKVFESQDSARMSTLAHADGLLIRPINDPAQDIGAQVTILDFADFNLL